ncbi:MAG: GPR endopeptidase [Clostridiales bacterium]|nr:GPR endopeptidase [Clostridiales bacterium]
MRYRTDLAIEYVEDFESAAELSGDDTVRKLIDGAEIEEKTYDEDIKVTRIRITDERGEMFFKKRKGNYITLEVDGIVDEKEGIRERGSKALANELVRLTGEDRNLNVLVTGLGNDKVTPDALGPFTVSKLRVTRHLYTIYNMERDPDISNVSAFVPGVTGTTGIETAELIKRAVEIVKPDVVIVIDSLAARNVSRINTTIQINDTGISPGSGMGNVRKMLDRETLGCKVIAIGVPTVIDAGTLVIDALSKFENDNDAIDSYLNENEFDMVVTSTDIDTVIKDFSDIIANGINIMLHPGIYS